MRIRTLFFVLWAALAPGLAHAQSWETYRPEGAGYSISFPGEWRVEAHDMTTKVGAIKLYTASFRSSTAWYGSSYSVYPKAIVTAANVTKILDGARDGAVKNVKGTLRSETRIVISNRPARHIVVDVPGNLVFVENLLMVDNALVQAIVVGAPGIESNPDTIKFLESLKAQE